MLSQPMMPQSSRLPFSRTRRVSYAREVDELHVQFWVWPTGVSRIQTARDTSHCISWIVAESHLATVDRISCMHASKGSTRTCCSLLPHVYWFALPKRMASWYCRSGTWVHQGQSRSRREVSLRAAYS